MALWFLENERRFFEERRAVRDLELRCSEWLRGVDWKLGVGGLGLEADILAHGVIYPVLLTFPDQYPAVVPTIAPRDRKARWSDHQYFGGTLCTEVGQDNWSPEVMTAATLIESTFRLLGAENPLGQGPQQEVISRHKTSIGQDLRGESWRFLATPELQAYASDLARSMASGKTVMLIVSQGKTRVTRVWRIEANGREPWSDPTFPMALEEAGFTLEGLLRSVEATAEEIRAVTTVEALAHLVGAKGGPNGPDFLEEIASCTAVVPTVLLVCPSGRSHLLVLCGKDAGEHVFECTILVDETLRPDARRRLPPEVESLAGKRVGIVGVGSVGSKSAMSLARYGVRNFVLVDDDVLFGANLLRHDLDWRSVGMHKVDSLSHQLNLVAPGMKIDARSVTIAGQESTATSASAYKALAACDLIVDASGDDETFGLLAYLAAQEKLRLAWAQVFAGGIGGLVARYRPGKDPTPFRMRDAFLTWAKENETEDFPGTAPVIPYGAAAEGNDSVQVAGDGQVGVVASQLVLLALDTLLDREPSNYPYSMYVMGLEAGWVFEAPFQTIPLRTDHLPFDPAVEPATEEMRAENSEFLRTLLQEMASENPATA